MNPITFCVVGFPNASHYFGKCKYFVDFTPAKFWPFFCFYSTFINLFSASVLSVLIGSALGYKNGVASTKKNSSFQLLKTFCDIFVLLMWWPGTTEISFAKSPKRTEITRVLLDLFAAAAAHNRTAHSNIRILIRLLIPWKMYKNLHCKFKIKFYYITRTNFALRPSIVDPFWEITPSKNHPFLKYSLKKIIP